MKNDGRRLKNDGRLETMKNNENNGNDEKQ